MLSRLCVVVSVVAFLVGSTARPAGAQDEALSHADQYQVYPTRPAVSVHEVMIGGKRVRYVATAQVMPLVGKDYEPDARVFTVSYRKVLREPNQRELQALGMSPDVSAATGADMAEPDLDSLFPDPTKRPITFSFNGGPGSSSV